MFKEPKPMREIHKIQEKLYEERKRLSADKGQCPKIDGKIRT